ncbi:MAG TPA: hypothetical protein VIT45_03270 [Allosphingosinicella sp.]
MRSTSVAVLLAAALATAGCATRHHDYGYTDGMDGGDYAYAGTDYDRLGNDCGTFGGSGGDMLDPWLACTGEGEDLVRALFGGRDGRIDEATADRANIWFRRHADTNRDLRLTDPEIKAALVNHIRHASR